MSLLNPYALAALPLIAVLLLVARRRVPRPRRAVANLYLWRQTTALDPARMALARLRRHRLLALQIAFMLAVIAALARPAINWRARPEAQAPIADQAERRVATGARVDPIRVLLRTAGNFFLEQSLLTNPALTVDRERQPGVRYDVVVCDACGESPVEGSGVLVISAPDGTAAAEPLTVGDSDHPIGAALMALGPGPVFAMRASRPDAATIDGDVILRAGGAPLLVASTATGRRTLTLNANLSSSSLPLTTVFPVLIANAIEWLAARDSESAALNRTAPPESDASSGTRRLGRVDLRESLSTGLLLGALALLFVEWRYWSLQERRRPAVVCRLSVAVLLGLGAAGLKLPFGEASETVMFAIDRSGSLPADTQAAALARVNAMSGMMRSGDRAGVVAFGLEASLERPLTTRLQVNDIASTVSPAGTDIETALRTARLALPADGSRRIVLVSDGRATVGDASREIARAAAEGIQVDTVAADAAAADRLLIVKSVAAPSDVRVGEPFIIGVEIAGPPGAHGRLAMTGDGEAALVRDIEIAPDGTANAAFTDQRRESGVYAYRAVLDDQPAAGTMVTVAGAPQILYAGTASSPLADALATSGFLVRHVASDALPTSAGELARYDGIVLDEVPADRLSSSSAAAIATYVEQSGGGLLMLGGPRTLDASGYPEGPLGRVLPIDLRPRNGQRSPAMGLVVAFDKSGSMADLVSGVAKIELARQAVRKVVDAVRTTDAIGVVAFDAAPVVVSPLTVSTDPRRLAEDLRAITPGGSTAISPALARAADWLRRANVSRRHVLLVSDGRTPPADAERLRDTVKGGGFELSVIAIGADADRAFLEELATGTGGRAYFPDDLRQLPILAAREAARAAGGGVVDERFLLRATVHPITTGIERVGLPSMNGYVVGAVKPGAEAVLLSHLDDPILAAWRFGLGRVAVYTADLRSPWSAGLRRWSGFGQLWLQTARWVGRRENDRALHASIVDASDGVRLVVDAETEQPSDRLQIQATVRGPDGEQQQVTLQTVTSGRYEGPLHTQSPGPYVASIAARAVDGGMDVRLLRGFYWSANRERRATGADMTALRQIAQATGGRVLGPNDNPFAGPRPRANHEMWTAAAIAALLLFLVEVALRRGISLRKRTGPIGPVVASRAAAA
jgi:Mg-chelatase subunit ChlD